MKKKRVLLAFLSLMMILVLIASGCGGTEEPAAVESPAGTPVIETPDEKVLEFRFSTHTPEDAVAYWAKRVEEDTGGRVKITVYAHASLMDYKDTLSGLKDGIADIAFVAPETFPEAFPLNNVLVMPFMPLSDKEQQIKIWHELQGKFPELPAEWDEFQVLYDDTMYSNTLHMVNFAAKVPEDMDGLRMFAGATVADIMEEYGATPLFLEVPDWFTSLDRGLLDGMWLPWDALLELNIYPLLPYHTTFPSAPGMLNRNTFMRKEAWNTIPPDLQKIILDIAPDERSHFWNALDGAVTAVRKAAISEGGTIVDLTPEEVDKWYQAAKPFHDAYIEKVNAMGLPATEVYNEALRLGKEYSK